MPKVQPITKKAAPSGRNQRNISLTDPVNHWLEKASQREGYDNATTYAAELIRRAYVQETQARREMKSAA